MKIILEKSKCIGCGACEALCSKLFELKESRSHLKNSKENSEEREELEVDNAECAEDVVAGCPAQCVSIK